MLRDQLQRNLGRAWRNVEIENVFAGGARGPHRSARATYKERINESILQSRPTPEQYSLLENGTLYQCTIRDVKKALGCRQRKGLDPFLRWVDHVVKRLGYHNLVTRRRASRVSVKGSIERQTLNMKIPQEWLARAVVLLEQAGIVDAENEANRLWTRLASMHAYSDQVAPEHELIYFRLIDARLTGLPLEYELGFREFCGRRFHVDRRGFVPRDRTERLVTRTIELSTRHKGNIIDIGTGSGAVAITIGLETSRRVYATDISFPALCLARENSARHQADIVFCQADLLQPFRISTFDLIVANLPYTPSGALYNRIIHEPLAALTPGPTGLEAYKLLIQHSKRALQPGGRILLQIDDHHAADLEALFSDDWKVFQRTPLDPAACAVEAQLL